MSRIMDLVDQYADASARNWGKAESRRRDVAEAITELEAARAAPAEDGVHFTAHNLVAAPARNAWEDAVIDELVIGNIYKQEHDTNPRKAVQDAINWNVQIALDPQVSSDAQALIDRGKAEAAIDVDEAMRLADEYYGSAYHDESTWERNALRDYLEGKR